jgi:hypothetical protein
VVFNEYPEPIRNIPFPMIESEPINLPETLDVLDSGINLHEESTSKVELTVLFVKPLLPSTLNFTTLPF